MTNVLTREQVLSKGVGRELDFLIAKEIMKVIKNDVDERLFSFAYDAGNHNYSTNIAAAFEAETKVIEKDPSMYVHALAAVVFGYNQVQDISDIRKMCMLIHATPEQRCKAALLAVMDG